jgi:hypothetical protein
MYDIWYYDRDAHSTGKVTVDTIDELYNWFMKNGGYCCSVIITNMCEHRDDEEEES